MKRFLLVAALAVGPFFTKAQLAGYKEGHIIFTGGANFATNVFKSGFKTKLPFAPTIGAEYAFSDNMGVGYSVSFINAKFNSSDANETIETNTYVIDNILRFSYHFTTSEYFDPYIVAGLGRYISKGKTKIVNHLFGYEDTNDEFASEFSYIGGIGARYYLKTQWGFYAEAGYSKMGYVRAGICARF